MKSHAKVVVIGGGVVGCSVLYHLARGGWTDVLLLERSELTSGSTWHAAGGMHTINGDPNVAKLQKYTIELYREIEDLSGQATGVHLTGGVMLAATEARLDWMKGIVAKNRYLDIECELISPAEAHRLMPLLDPAQFIGAVRTVVDGHLDPSGVTHAYAKAARKLGASVELQCLVTDLSPLPDGTWKVTTGKGEIIAEHVVNAAGLWAREVGRMAGLTLPILAMEHMYLLTQDMPEVAEANRLTGGEVIHAIDFDGELYLRQERGGMLMGTYEKGGKPWSPRVTPWDFGHELLAPDIDRIAPSLEVGFRHFPAFQTAGIKQIVNGPFTFAPDGNPLVGPIRGLRGLWAACGVMAGFSQGGGVGLALANWMIDGDPGFDVFAMDVARYGDWAGMAWTSAKVQENYSRRFSIRFPNEELTAARGLRTVPLHDTWAALGAQFGVVAGVEVPLWFAPEGVRDSFSWRRSSDFDHVGAEARAVRSGVGIAEISGFAKYRVEGPGAAAWLDRILAGRMPADGRMALAPMLKDDGKVIGDFTLANLGDHWMITGSGAAEDYHMRWFLRHLPPDESVRIRALGLALAGLHIAGPKAREVLEAACGGDPGAFPFMAVRRLEVGLAPALVGRVSYTGDLGYEIWLRAEYQRVAFDALMAAGGARGIRPFGSRAMNALRLEKGYGSWAREYRPIYHAVETGLDRFIAWSKPDFIGKAAAQAARDDGGRLRLVSLALAARDADVIGDEPIWHGGDVVGWVTSGGYAHASEASVAMGYVPRDLSESEGPWEIELLGERLPAALLRRPLFDANGSRMRAD